MRTIPAEKFTPEATVAELLDGSGAVRLPQLFDSDQAERAREIILTETTDRKLIGSHFNQDD